MSLGQYPKNRMILINNAPGLMRSLCDACRNGNSIKIGRRAFHVTRIDSDTSNYCLVEFKQDEKLTSELRRKYQDRCYKQAMGNGYTQEQAEVIAEALTSQNYAEFSDAEL